MKRLIFILLFPYLTLLLIGCNDNPTESSTIISKSIKKVLSSNEDFVKYYYRESLLTKKERFFLGELETSITFTYDDKGKLIRQDEFSKAAGIPLSNYLTYEYSLNNLLFETSVFLKKGDTYEFGGRTQFEYESNKLVKSTFYDKNNELRQYKILKYDGENIIEEAQYDGNNILQYLQTFEYDDKLNPLTKDISFISAFTLSKNNITKWTNAYYTVSPANINISTSSYTYNYFGYPIKCVTVYNNNGGSSKNTSTSYYEYY